MWMWQWSSEHPPMSMCACVCLFVCVFIHVRMSTREHWGALRQHTASSLPLFDPAGTVRSSQQLGATSAVQHGGGGSAPLNFYSVPAGRHHVDLAMLAPSPWSQAPVSGLTHTLYLKHTHFLATHTFFSTCYYSSLTLVVVLVVLSRKRTWGHAERSRAAGDRGGEGEWVVHLVVLLQIAVQTSAYYKLKGCTDLQIHNIKSYFGKFCHDTRKGLSWTKLRVYNCRGS